MKLVDRDDLRRNEALLCFCRSANLLKLVVHLVRCQGLHLKRALVRRDKRGRCRDLSWHRHVRTDCWCRERQNSAHSGISTCVPVCGAPLTCGRRVGRAVLGWKASTNWCGMGRSCQCCKRSRKTKKNDSLFYERCQHMIHNMIDMRIMYDIHDVRYASNVLYIKRMSCDT